MAFNPLNVPVLLRSAFLKSELDCLTANASFEEAMAATNTADDFKRLCELAETLLSANAKINPSAHQLRKGLRQTQA